MFVSSNGRFVIENAFSDGAVYDVAARCKVAGGKGVIEDADVNDVTIACSRTTLSLGGKVTGLHSVGLVLEARGEAIALPQDGTFPAPSPTAQARSRARTSPMYS